MDENASPVGKIWEAISKGDVKRARDLLVEHPDQINSPIPFGGGTFLHLAASKDNVEMVKSLVDIGFDINKESVSEGDTALATASSYGNYSVVRYLLDNGALIDTSSPAKNPLFGSIIGRSLAIAELLLRRGVDSSVRYTGDNMKNMDAIAFALERGERDIALALAKWNAKGDALATEKLMTNAMEVARANNSPK